LIKDISNKNININKFIHSNSEFSPSCKYLLDYNHKMSVIPPSEHNIAMFRKL